MTDGGDEQVAAEQAFEALRSEVRRGTERLEVMVGQAGDAANHDETLGLMAQEIAGLKRQVMQVRARPALDYTPETFARALHAAGHAVRSEDRWTIQNATDRVNQIAHGLALRLETAREAAAQIQHTWRTAIIATLVGLFMGVTWTGGLARATPDSWLLPERMAARALRVPMWEAGIQLMKAYSPEAWNRLAVSSMITSGNERRMERCAKAAVARGRAVCEVVITRGTAKAYLNR